MKLESNKNSRLKDVVNYHVGFLMIFCIGLGFGLVIGKKADAESNIELLILFVIGLCALIKMFLFVTCRHQKSERND